MILFFNCRLEQIRLPPLSALNDIEAMIVQTDSTCIWAVYEWYCTRIFFCKWAKHVDRLFAKLYFFQNWVDCGWGLYRIICQEEIWELLKCCKGCFQNLGGCSFYMLTLVTAKLYPLFVICTWVHPIFQFSSPASRMSFKLPKCVTSWPRLHR